MIGGLGGLIACAFTGGPEAAAGISALLGGLAMTMDGLEGAADDVAKLAKHPGSVEGQEEIPVHDPGTGKEITDIDLVENGALVERKSATTAPDPVGWSADNVTNKIWKYIEAREIAPELAEYRDAPIIYRMTTPGVQPELRAAIEEAFEEGKQYNPGIDLRLEFE